MQQQWRLKVGSIKWIRAWHSFMIQQHLFLWLNGHVFESTGCQSIEVKDAVLGLCGLTGSRKDRWFKMQGASAMQELCLGIWESTQEGVPHVEWGDSWGILKNQGEGTSFTKIQRMCNIKSCVYKPNQEISNMPRSPF